MPKSEGYLGLRQMGLEHASWGCITFEGILYEGDVHRQKMRMHSTTEREKRNVKSGHREKRSP